MAGDELPKQNGTKRNKIQKEYNKAGVTALERSMLTTGQVKQVNERSNSYVNQEYSLYIQV
jgi:hypothetical protein